MSTVQHCHVSGPPKQHCYVYFAALDLIRNRNIVLKFSPLQSIYMISIIYDFQPDSKTFIYIKFQILKKASFGKPPQTPFRQCPAKQRVGLQKK